MMTSNKEELRNINKIALVAELIHKTRACGITWSQLNPSQYKTQFESYDVYMTQTSGGTYILDVIKDARHYRSYNSSFQPEITELFLMIEAMITRLQKLEKQKETMLLISGLRKGCKNYYNEVGSGGTRIGGSPDKFLLVPMSKLLLPYSLTFSPESVFPWIGNVYDIDDQPNAIMHDDDDSFIRQEVYGPPPTNWGYAYIGFDESKFPPSGPYTISTNIVHRRESQPGSNLKVAVMSDSAIIFNDQEPCQLTYSVYNSGSIYIDSVQIEEFVIRVNNYSNTGNNIPIAIRITAADLTVDGFTRFYDGTEVVRAETNYGCFGSGSCSSSVRYRPTITGKSYVSGSAIVEYYGSYVTLGGSAIVEKYTP